jgi:hypothetical protein
VSTIVHLLPEHNSACERARLSTCNCFCHGAGHQHDLLKRAVSCTTVGENNLAQLLADLQDIYGGFRSGLRDGSTPSRRKVPDDLAQMGLDRGRGATWVETLLLDEALHAAFVEVARSSVMLTDLQRAERRTFVVELAEGALRIVGGDVDAHNISDGHLWCSVLAESNSASSSPPAAPLSSPYGRIAYPRSRSVRIPRDLAAVRARGFAHVQSVHRAHRPSSAVDDIVRLMGAASCPDLWHHPAAVRYSLLPFVSSSSWPPANSTTLARSQRFDVLEDRWQERGNW